MTNYRKIFIIFLFVILLIFPLAGFSQTACRELEVPIPGLEETCLPALPDYIVAIYNFALMIIGIICFGALLYGGFRYLTSAGKPAAMADAKDQIFSALLGLIILFSSYLILTTINPELAILSEPPGGRCTSNDDCPAGLVCVVGALGGICTYTTSPVLQCSSNDDCFGDQVCADGLCSAPGLPQGGWTGCGSYTTPTDCTNANCEWCPVCDGTLINQWETDKCVDPGTDCGYTCIVGECEASSCP